jgi:hypothetical protein
MMMKEDRRSRGGPTFHLSPLHNQLISERGVLCFKPALRLEWRDHDGQDKA